MALKTWVEFFLSTNVEAKSATLGQRVPPSTKPWRQPTVAGCSELASCGIGLLHSQHIQLDLRLKTLQKRLMAKTTCPPPTRSTDEEQAQRQSQQQPNMWRTIQREGAPQQQGCSTQHTSQETEHRTQHVKHPTAFEDAQVSATHLPGQICVALCMRPEQSRRQQQKFQQQRGHQCARDRINQQTPNAAAAPTPAAMSTEFKGACWM